MADNLQGFNDELASNAVNAAQRIGEIQDAVRSLRRVLQGETVSTTKEFTDLTSSANKFKQLQEKAAKSGKEINKIYQEQSKIHDTITRLSAKIQIANEKAFVASGKQRKNLEKQAEALMHMRDEAKQLSSYYEQLVQSTTKLDKSSAYFTQLSKVVDKIPILNKFQKPFEKAAEAARKTAIEAKKAQQISATVEKRTDSRGRDYYVDLIKGGRTSKTNYIQDQAKVQEASVAAKKTPFGAGMKAMGSEMGEGMSGMIKGGGWIALLVEAIKFIVELMVSAQQRMVEIAKDFSITREAAEQIRLSYIDIAANSSNILMNTKNLVEAQQQFSEYTNEISWTTADALRNQVFLTKNLGIAADKAADFNYMMLATGQDIAGSTNMVSGMATNFQKINGSTVPTAKILKSIASTSKEIQGYFGFTVKSLAEGVLKMSKFGLELSDALSLSKSLLDFESSIGNELELELLTGKEFNLEKARALAVTGKIADATTEVLNQMQDLTEEQRKSPLVMESMAKTAGLSADQLNRAYIVNKKLNGEAKAYYEHLVKQGKEKQINSVLDQLGEQATQAEMERTITVQDAFNAAMEKAKDQLSKFVGSGALDKLVDIITSLVNTVSKHGIGGLFSVTGKSEFGKELDKVKEERYTGVIKGYQEKLKNNATITQKEKEEYSQAKDNLSNLRDPEKAWRATSMTQTYEEMPMMATGGIVSKPTRALVGEAGREAVIPLTEFYAKIDELIKVTKETKNIYLGTQKVNEALGLSLNALG